MPDEPNTALPAIAEAMELELFDAQHLPVREDVVELVRSRSFVPEQKPDRLRYSGKIVLKRLMNDVELAEAVCTALVMGLSCRLIGLRFGMSPRSVATIREAMTARGELTPVRLRIQAKLDRVLELGLERWEEGILDGTIHPGQLPIPTLAALDKKGQLEAGVIAGTGRTEREITADEVRAEWAALKAMADAPSEGLLPKPPPIGPSAPPDTVLDTTCTPVDGLPGRQAPAAAAAADPAPAMGGEGVDAGPPDPPHRPLGPPKTCD